MGTGISLITCTRFATAEFQPTFADLGQTLGLEKSRGKFRVVGHVVDEALVAHLAILQTNGAVRRVHPLHQAIVAEDIGVVVFLPVDRIAIAEGLPTGRWLRGSTEIVTLSFSAFRTVTSSAIFCSTKSQF